MRWKYVYTSISESTSLSKIFPEPDISQAIDGRSYGNSVVLSSPPTSETSLIYVKVGVWTELQPSRHRKGNALLGFQL